MVPPVTGTLCSVTAATASRRLCACGSSGMTISSDDRVRASKRCDSSGRPAPGPYHTRRRGVPAPLEAARAPDLNPKPGGGILRETPSVPGAGAAALLPWSERDGWPARRAADETAAESTPPDAPPAAAPRGVAAPEVAATVSPACSRFAFAAAPREEREPPVAWARSPSQVVSPHDVTAAAWRGPEHPRSAARAP